MNTVCSECPRLQLSVHWDENLRLRPLLYYIMVSRPFLPGPKIMGSKMFPRVTCFKRSIRKGKKLVSKRVMGHVARWCFLRHSRMLYYYTIKEWQCTLSMYSVHMVKLNIIWIPLTFLSYKTAKKFHLLFKSFYIAKFSIYGSLTNLQLL